MREEEETMCEIVGWFFYIPFNVLVDERVKGCCCSVKTGHSGV